MLHVVNGSTWMSKSIYHASQIKLFRSTNSTIMVTQRAGKEREWGKGTFDFISEA
jgi:hypothetical protein